MDGSQLNLFDCARIVEAVGSRNDCENKDLPNHIAEQSVVVDARHDDGRCGSSLDVNTSRDRMPSMRGTVAEGQEDTRNDRRAEYLADAICRQLDYYDRVAECRQLRRGLAINKRLQRRKSQLQNDASDVRMVEILS